MQVVIRYRMQGAFIYPAGIIAVNDLAHQPEIRLDFICDMAQCFHIFKVQHVRGIQTDSIDIKFADPETDYVADVITDCRIVLV